MPILDDFERCIYMAEYHDFHFQEFKISVFMSLCVLLITVSQCNLKSAALEAFFAIFRALFMCHMVKLVGYLINI